MPYRISKGTGGGPWRIISEETGKVVGFSVTKKDAEASIRARNAGAHGWKVKRLRGSNR